MLSASDRHYFQFLALPSYFVFSIGTDFPAGDVSKESPKARTREVDPVIRVVMR